MGRTLAYLFAMNKAICRQVLTQRTILLLECRYEFYYPKDQHWYETKGYPASPGAILVFRDITAIKTSSALS